ncbi:unnamed protein product [Ectocarpus sp. 12 AP-2014]
MAERKASALEYKKSLKRKPAGAAGSTSPTSSKKPRTPAKPAKTNKAEARKSSRKNAAVWAKVRLNKKRTSGEETSSEDEHDNGSDAMETSDLNDDTPGPSVRNPPAKRPAPSRNGRTPRPALPPPMSETISETKAPPSTSWPGSGSGSGKRSAQPMSNGSPPAPPPGTPTTTKRTTGRRLEGKMHTPSRKNSFLRHANGTEGTDSSTAASASNGPSLISENLGGPNARGQARRGPSFLDRECAGWDTVGTAGAEGRTPDMKGTRGQKDKSKSKVDSLPQPAPAAAAADDGDGDDARPRRGKSLEWAFKCAVMMVLAPVMVLLLVSGLLVAWPHVQVAAGGAWGAFRGLTAKTPPVEKCFLQPGEQEDVVCKGGTEAADCPDHATCGAGRILHCNLPYTLRKDRAACVLVAEAEKEAKAVVEALRTLTAEELCKGKGLIMPKASSRGSFITLTDAAAAQNRGSLSLLAGMPQGNVVGLIELEGEPAQVFGGGQDGAEDCAGSGMERVARLSESAHDAVMGTLGWRCKARLAAGSWFMTYWQYCLAMYCLVVGAVCLDLRRRNSYYRHVQVCTIRDVCYQTLLDHASKDSSAMQVSHIQSSVTDWTRQRVAKNRATIQRLIADLWPLVEREVEHDERIRRCYKSLAGKRNVACWKWVGPTGTSFETIGALNPGRAPRLLLLRCQERARPMP